MNLKNYTSNVSAETTISYIEAYLADCGVTGITKQIEQGKPVALFFHIELGQAGKYTIKLPAKVADVHEYLWRDYCANAIKPRKVKADFADQACRTAWKIQQDWVQVQMSLIKLKQVDFLEVFMGFIWDGNQTYYNSLKGSGFKALPERT
jgi:hypothetical protein